MRWPSLFALLSSCEEKRVNVNQMVPVILKGAFTLSATRPLPPPSTALTPSTHLFSRPQIPPNAFLLSFRATATPASLASTSSPLFLTTSQNRSSRDRHITQPLLNRRLKASNSDPEKLVSVPSLAYGITQVTIFISAKAECLVS